MDQSNQSEAGVLLDQLLESLLADFDHWFQRGDELLRCCPDDVMGKTERDLLAARLTEGKKAITATRSLVSASSQPMAVSMGAMSPWHGLVTEVWGLAAKLAKYQRNQTLT